MNKKINVPAYVRKMSLGNSQPNLQNAIFVPVPEGVLEVYRYADGVQSVKLMHLCSPSCDENILREAGGDYFEVISEDQALSLGLRVYKTNCFLKKKQANPLLD